MPVIRYEFTTYDFFYDDKRPGPQNYCFIELDYTESEVSAEVLNSVSKDATGLIICKRGSSSVRLLGPIPDMKVLTLQCVSTGLETDDIFANCKSLTHLWICGCNETIFSTMKYIPALPLQVFGIQGYGTVNHWGNDFTEHIRSSNIPIQAVY